MRMLSAASAGVAGKSSRTGRSMLSDVVDLPVVGGLAVEPGAVDFPGCL